MIRTVSPTTVRVVSPRNGISSTRELNAAIGSAFTSIRFLSSTLNDVANLLNTLPSGGRVIDQAVISGSPNPFTNGLDGANIYIDNFATVQLSNGEFYDNNAQRPLTIKEYVVSVKQGLNLRLSNLESDVAYIRNRDATGLTQQQKDRIGLRIFDTTQTSSPTSLDGQINLLTQHLQQLAADVYNSGTVIGDPLTSYGFVGSTQTVSPTLVERVSSLETTVGSLAPTVNSQTDVPSTIGSTPPLTEDDNYIGTPATLADDLNKLRTIVKDLKGTASWDAALTTMPVSGVNSLEGILTFNGTAPAATATNIFAQDIRDFTDQDELLGIINVQSGEAIALYDVVYISGGDTVSLANSTNISTSYAIGLALDVAASAGVNIRVALSGHVIKNVLVGATAGTVYYLDPANPGKLTTVVPTTAGEYIVKVGIAKNATDLILMISDPIGVV